MSRLEVEDEGKSQLVLMPLVTLNDDAVETLKMIDPEDRERTHSVLVKPYHNCLEMDSPHLTSYIKDHLLVSPSTAEYNFSRPLDQLNETSLQGEVGQPLEVDQIVYGGELKDGFFIEAGAHDFETNSDSLYFEMKHNWSGLLVEPHPLGFHKGLRTNRKVWGVQTCLSTNTRPETMWFDLRGSVRNETTREAMAGLVLEENSETVRMQCLPLYSLLLALGNPTVHYLSLDIEGAELPVLKTIPWQKVDIRVMTVETHLAGRIFPGSREDLISYLDQAGYRHLSWAHRNTNQARTTLGTTDDLFVRKDVPLRYKEEL